MCGKADDAPPPPSIPIELPSRRPADAPASHRPQTGSERPRHRPHSSAEHRPQSHKRRPQSERKTRPGTSSARPPKTSEHKRRGSSHRGEHPTRDRPRRDIEPIMEYTEDRTILRRVADLGTFIDQHAENFSSGYSGIPEMDDPRTRHPAIRRYITQKVISSVIMVGPDSAPDTTEIANEIAYDLKAYSSSNGKHKDHLRSLCKLGDELRRDMEDHPSNWEFGSFESGRDIVLVPALFRDGKEVVPSQIFRVT